MSYPEFPAGVRLEPCPECGKLFGKDLDNPICKHCKGGYRITDGKLFVVNKERFAKQKDYIIKKF